MAELEKNELTLSDLGRLDVLWASCFGVGFFKPAPGTWGSIAAVGLWWWLLSPLAMWLQLAIIGGYFFVSWWVSERVCQRYAIADAPQIVADEVAGMWLALSIATLIVPQTWLGLVACLGLFRLLDIAKPSAIGWLDHNVKGGLGVMLDDMLAGLVSGIIVGFVAYLTIVYLV